MSYTVTRHDNTRISVKMNEQLVYELERENQGRGIWALFPVDDGKRGAKIMSDQYSNDLLEMITSNLICAGHIARVEGGFVVPVPADAGDIYVSGTGYLCARRPVRRVLSKTPVLGLTPTSHPYTKPSFRTATAAEREAAGLNVNDAAMSAIFLEAA
jgi:hypothetical protein